MKHTHIYMVGVILFFAAAVLWYRSSAVPEVEEAKPIVVLNGTPVWVDVADSEKERTQGLSGRDPLAAWQGMLFVFDTPGLYGFWMKDMKFAIDIAWIDESLHIIHMAKEAKPESYPESFAPPSPARYVIEVPAGFLDSHGVSLGQEVKITNI